ncbi:MAG: OmpA family protein [Bdellovibrio sp.]|nr:OmpA family protein [Bdellovibrio sp.]
MFKNLLKVVTISLFIFSCASSVKKVSLPADTNIKTAIAEGDVAIQKAYSNQWDVLAQDELNKSSSYLKKAKQADRDGKDQAKVVEHLEMYQAYYNEAQSMGASRSARVSGLLAARETALASGIHQDSKENKEFAKLDSDFRDLAADSKIDAKDYAELQKKYLNLAAAAKKNTALATARKQIEEARNNRASQNAPSSLNMAELDVKSAENMIDANQGNVETYQPSIDKANRSAALLAAVVAEQKRANFNLDEGSAKRLVQQKGMIAKMDADLAAQKAMLSNSRSEYIAAQIALENSKQEGDEKEKQLTEKETQLAAQGKLLSQAEADQKFQTALETARKQFSTREADVYRQGDKLLIRLKTVGFATGAATLPDTSKSILDKVTSVAKQLSPKEIMVEGHTDSVGAANVNDELSKKRADTVATYLKEQGMPKAEIQSVGFGFQKPLASNKSKEGRAQNRRVDIWITPEGMQKAPVQDSSKTE